MDNRINRSIIGSKTGPRIQYESNRFENRIHSCNINNVIQIKIDN